MPVPAAPTAAVLGQPARSAEQFNALAAQVAFLLDSPTTFAYQATAQSIINVTPALITLDAEVVDTDNVHSLVTNTSRLTIVSAGRYRVAGQIAWAINVSGYRGARLLKSGVATAFSRTMAVPGVGNIVQVYDEIICVAGDYIEMAGEQSSGAALSTFVAAGDTSLTFLKARWAGIS